MDEILAALEEQIAELDSLIAPVDPAAWANPSRCSGWTVSDVVLHLAQTNEMALASVHGRFAEVLTELTRDLPPSQDVDDGAGMMVDHERGAPPAAVYARWRDGADALVAAFRKADAHDRVQWVAGTLSVHTLCTTRLAETWIHANDVAHGLGVTLPPSERQVHIARLAWRTLPYAFTRAGKTMSGTVAMQLLDAKGNDVSFEHAEPSETIVRGSVTELCEVAGQRADAAATGLTAVGPDGEAALQLVRTFASARYADAVSAFAFAFASALGPW